MRAPSNLSTPQPDSKMPGAAFQSSKYFCQEACCGRPPGIPAETPKSLKLMKKRLYYHRYTLIHFGFQLPPQGADSSVRGLSIERERVMNLQGSITELQNTVAQIYLRLEQRFTENQIIRDLWSAMAHDIEHQKRGMNALPSSFWQQMKAEKDGLLEAVSLSVKKQLLDRKEDSSLKNCFEHALLFEEPATLNVYVPIIRKLRENWTNQALDFYITVKAHLARITRATQSFAGDPLVIQRSNLLLERFEKEVQEPPVAAEPKIRKAHAIPPTPEKHGTKPLKKKASKPAATLAKHAGSHHKHAKPLVEKINLQRRRARR